jgi:hypothetical protein
MEESIHKFLVWVTLQYTPLIPQSRMEECMHNFLFVLQDLQKSIFTCALCFSEIWIE